MIIGDGEIFNRVFMNPPDSDTRGNASLELVAFSRVKSPDCMAVGNKVNDLINRNIQNIGKSVVYTMRRKFQQELENMDQQTRQPTIDAITALDTVEESLKTYKGG